MSWKYGLLTGIKDPSKVLFSDDDVVVIKDMYPKAECHFLVLPTADIPSIESLNKTHLELLRKMHVVGNNISREHGAGKTFRLGYHARPSMFRLHLHVVSDDFNSPCLKNKKHWNSFTTGFFLDSNTVISNLESQGRVRIPSPRMCSELLKTPLRCHKCDYSPATIPKLKSHLLIHLK